MSFNPSTNNVYDLIAGAGKIMGQKLMAKGNPPIREFHIQWEYENGLITRLENSVEHPTMYVVQYPPVM